MEQEEQLLEEQLSTIELVVKPGWQTTEFWLTLISQAVPVLVLLGVLNPTESDGIQEGANHVIITGFAFVQAVVVAVMYIWNRAKVKTGG